MYKKEKLENGLTVAYRSLQDRNTVSVGVWIRVGSMDEGPDEMGISHLIEHMLFKGTERRTALDIAMTVDAIGGELNAFTSKEATCVYATVLREDLPCALDILSDLVLYPTLTPDHFAVEKQVVLDEIMMYEDDGEEMLFDVLHESMLGGHPLSHPILGTAASVEAITPEQLKDYYRRHYLPSNMVLSVAGAFDEALLLETSRRFFGVEGSLLPQVHRAGAPERILWNSSWKHKAFEHIHVALCFPGYPYDAEASFALMALSAYIGESNSSQLFQILRESLGLVYSIYSEVGSYMSVGMFYVGMSVSEDRFKEAIEQLAAVLKSVQSTPLSEALLSRMRTHLRGDLLIAMESLEHQMEHIGRAEALGYKDRTIDDILKQIDAISLHELQSVKRAVLDPNRMALAVVGPVSEARVSWAHRHLKNVLHERGGTHENSHCEHIVQSPARV